MRLQDKNAIITGAASGIGFETSCVFVREGARVLMVDNREQELLRAQDRIQELFPERCKDFTDISVGDVSSEQSVAQAVSKLDAYGGLDLMVNNAGIMHMDDSDALQTSESVWDRTFDINVKGVWYGCKHAILSLRRHNKKAASIINVASIVAIMGAAEPQLAYTASKGAVLAMTRELAIAHAKEGFRFNSLCPAPLNTALLQDWLKDDPAARDRRVIHFPSGRFGEPIEQANAILFLASDESSFVNGTDFVVDGGMTKAYITPLGDATARPQNFGMGR